MLKSPLASRKLRIVTGLKISLMRHAIFGSSSGMRSFQNEKFKRW